MAARRLSFGSFGRIALLKQSFQVDCYSINLFPSRFICFQGRLVIYSLSNRFVTCLQASVYNINAYIFIVSVFVNITTYLQIGQFLFVNPNLKRHIVS